MCRHEEGDVIVPRMLPETWEKLVGGDFSPEGFWHHGEGPTWLTIEERADGPIWGFRVHPPGEDPDEGPEPYPMPPEHWHQIQDGQWQPDNGLISSHGHRTYRIIAVKIGGERWAHCEPV